MAYESEQQASHVIENLFYVHLAHKQPYGYKFRDRQRCPQCGLLQPKSQNEPDYLAALAWTYIEVKGPHEKWDFVHGEMISDIQRQRLSEHGGWLFFELGKGPRGTKNGLKAFLIPWKEWEVHEQMWIEDGKKTLALYPTPRGLPGAIPTFERFQLVWKDGRWIVPPWHDFWNVLDIYLNRVKQSIVEIRSHPDFQLEEDTHGKTQNNQPRQPDHRRTRKAVSQPGV